MFRRSAEAKANGAALQAQDEADRAEKSGTKEAKRAEKRAALQAEYEARRAKKKEGKEARAAERAKKLAGSVFASTPCYDSLWNYAVVFPDRVDERKKDDSIAKVGFLRDVTGWTGPWSPASSSWAPDGPRRSSARERKRPSR